jgi:hypothetical protein
MSVIHAATFSQVEQSPQAAVIAISNKIINSPGALTAAMNSGIITGHKAGTANTPRNTKITELANAIKNRFT